MHDPLMLYAGAHGMQSGSTINHSPNDRPVSGQKPNTIYPTNMKLMKKRINFPKSHKVAQDCRVKGKSVAATSAQKTCDTQVALGPVYWSP